MGVEIRPAQSNPFVDYYDRIVSARKGMVEAPPPTSDGEGLSLAPVEAAAPARATNDFSSFYEQQLIREGRVAPPAGVNPVTPETEAGAWRNMWNSLQTAVATPLESMAESADVAGVETVAGGLRAAAPDLPEGTLTATQQFMNPSESDAQLLSYGIEYLPRAALEQVGQVFGAIGTGVAGAVIGGAIGGPPGAAIGAFTGPTLFEAAQIFGPVAKERARNNGRETPNADDIAWALGTSATTGALNAWGAKYLPGGGENAGPLLQRIGKAALAEFTTETAQGFAQQAGETAGTAAGLDLQAREAFGEGLVGGAAGGAAGVLGSSEVTAPVQPIQPGAAIPVEELDDKVLGTDDSKTPAPVAEAPTVDEVQTTPVGEPPTETGVAAVPGAAPVANVSTPPVAVVETPAPVAAEPVTEPVPAFKPTAPAPAITPTDIQTPSGNTPNYLAGVTNNMVPAGIHDVTQALVAQVGANPEVLLGSTRLDNLDGVVRTVVTQIDYNNIPERKKANVARMLQALRDEGASPEISEYVKYRVRKFGFKEDYNKLRKEIEGYNELRGELDRIGLGKIAFKPSRGIDNKGFFEPFRNIIAVNYTTPGFAGERITTLHHEAIHALRTVGAFNTPEGAAIWNILREHVAKTGLKQTPFVQSYDLNWRVEEAIAELYGNYAGLKHATIKARREGVPQIVLDAIKRITQGFEIVKEFVEKILPLARREAEVMSPWAALDHIYEGKLSVPLARIGGQEYADARKVTASVERVLARVNVPPDQRIRMRKIIRTADHYNFMVKWGWNVIQLAKKNTHIGWLQEYVQRAGQWHNEKQKWLHMANETLVQWNSLPQDQQNGLAHVLFELEQMGYRSAQEVQAGVVRRPTRAELIAIMTKHKLNKEAVAVYIRVKSDFDAMLAKMEAIALKDVQRIFGPGSVPAQLETLKIQKEFAALRHRPYFPHARFGNFTIVVKDAKGKTEYMETFESRRERDRAMKYVKKQFPNSTVAASMLPEEAQTLRGLPPSILMAMKHTLNLSQQQEAALEQLMVQYSPSQSFKNHFVHRKDIKGYSKDALRAYSDYFFHGANHIARLEYAPDMQDAIKNGEANIKQMILNGEDSTKRVEMTDYLRHHLDNILNPKAEWATARSMGFLWWLGFNVKSALLNFTQLPMVSAPFLSAQFGDVRAMGAMTKAMKHVQQIYRSPQKAMAALSPQDAKAVSLGIEQGFLDESFAAMLAGVAEGNNLRRFGSRSYGTWLWFTNQASRMFQATEKINRRVTFMAAMDLARRNPNANYLGTIRSQYNIELAGLVNSGWSPVEATAFLAGKDAVRSTQFEYASWARPRFMQGRKSAFFTFVSFSQNMLWFLQNSPGSTRALVTMLAMAGIMGLPFAEDLEDLAAFVARQFGMEFNVQKELRELLVTMLGEEGAPPDLFLRGVSRYGFGIEAFGDMMGMPLPAIDMSGNVGMGSPLPVVSPAIRALAKQGDTRDKLATFVEEGLGATFGIGIGIMLAVGDTGKALDDPRRWEKAMPAALAAVSKARRNYLAEAETTTTGARVLEYARTDPEHMAELIAQALAFRTTRSAQMWDRTMMQRESQIFWETRRGMLLGQWDAARRGGNVEDRQDVLDAIIRFNNSLPFPQLAITRETRERSAASRDLARSRIESGLPQSKMMRGVYRDIERLHPEADPAPNAPRRSQEPAPGGG